VTNPDLVRVEAAISQLSFSEQLWLMERLTQRIRERSRFILSVDDREIEEMARDSAIQRELRDLEAECSIADHDQGEVCWARVS
jgi:hypothetical protein